MRFVLHFFIEKINLYEYIRSNETMKVPEKIIIDGYEQSLSSCHGKLVVNPTTGVITLVNESLIKMLGKEINTIKRLTRSFHPHDRHIVKEVLTTKIPISNAVDVKMVTEKGSILFCNLSMEYLGDDHLIFTFVDITEPLSFSRYFPYIVFKLKMFKDMDESETEQLNAWLMDNQRYKTEIASMLDPEVTYLNKEAENTFGFSIIPGKPKRIMDIIVGVSDDDVIDEFLQVIIDGPKRYNTILNGKEGRINCEVFCRFRKESMEVYGVAREIGKERTQFKQTQRAINYTLEDINLLICRFYPNFVLRFSNQRFASHFGYEKKYRLIGTKITDHMGKYKAEFVDILHGLTPDHPLSSIETIVKDKTGRYRIFQWTVRAIFAKGAEVDEFVLFGEDVTEFRNLQKENEQLKTNVTLLKEGNISVLRFGFLDLVKRRVGKINGLLRNVKGGKNVKLIEELNDEIHSIINALDTYSIPTDMLESNFKETAVSSLVYGSLNMLDGWVNEIEIRTTTKIAETVNVDRDMIISSIVAVCSNSIDAMDKSGKGSTINIIQDARHIPGNDIIRSGRYAVITIIDDGPGIPKKISNRLFSPFTTTSKKKVGLGLATAKKYIGLHKGQISINSSKHGTEVEILLPIELDEQSEYHGSNQHIVVVDKEPFYGKMSIMTLKENGYRATYLTTGKELIDFYHKNSNDVDLLLVDSNLPDMDVVKCIIEATKTDKTVEVVVTTDGSDDQRYVNSGLTDIIQKPYTGDRLLKEIFNLMGK